MCMNTAIFPNFFSVPKEFSFQNKCFNAKQDIVKREGFSNEGWLFWFRKTYDTTRKTVGKEAFDAHIDEAFERKAHHLNPDWN